MFNYFKHYKSPSFHTVIHIHLISLSYHILVILPSHFRYMEQMLMLMRQDLNQHKTEKSGYVEFAGKS